MIGVSVTFNYDGDFDRGRVIGVADNARGMFEVDFRTLASPG